jgi:hypothetical protein
MDANALDLFLVRLVAYTEHHYGTDHVKELAAAAGVKPVVARELEKKTPKKKRKSKAA